MFSFFLCVGEVAASRFVVLDSKFFFSWVVELFEIRILYDVNKAWEG